MAKYALLVGISEYQDLGISDLLYAARDAEVLGQCLEEDCEFDDVKVLVASEGGEEVTSGLIGQQLDRIAADIEPTDTFLFYFSGHGVHPEGKSFLLPSDAAADSPEFALPIGALKKRLARVNCAQHILIYDCCRNDSLAGKGEAENLLSKDLVAELAADSGGAPTTCTMFSCSPGQCSFEWRSKEHGVFTWYLLEGLRREGWNGGQLMLQQVESYVKEKVADWSSKLGREQDPWSELSGEIGPMVIAEKQGKDGGAGADEKLADRDKARQATDKAIEELTEKLEAARKEIEELKSEKPAEVESQRSDPRWDPGLQERLKQFKQASQAISQAEEAVDDLTEIKIRIEDEDYHEVEEEDLLEDLERAREQAEEAVGCAEEISQQGAAIAAAARRASREGQGRNPPELGYLLVGLSLCTALWLFSRLNWPSGLLALCILILVYAVYFAPRIASSRTKNRQDRNEPPQEGKFSQPQNFPTRCHLTPSSAEILRCAFIQHYNPYVRLLAAGHKGKDREPRSHASRGISMARSAFKKLKSSTREVALANMGGVEGIGGKALKGFARESNGEVDLFLYLVDLRLGVLSGSWERTAAEREALKEKEAKVEQARHASRTVRSDSKPSGASADPDEDNWVAGCVGCGVLIILAILLYWVLPAIAWFMGW